MKSVESLCKHLVECKESRRIITSEECIHERKAVLVIKNIKIAEHILILHVRTAECNSLVKDGQSITHSTICLVCNHMKRLIIDGDALIRSHHPEVSHNVFDSNPVKVICLTSRQDSREDLMLLSSGKNEYRMRRWFLQRLEEGIECRL